MDKPCVVVLGAGLGGTTYLVLATGPDLAFDEIEGLGPNGGFTHSICHVDHAEKTAAAF